MNEAGKVEKRGSMSPTNSRKTNTKPNAKAGRSGCSCGRSKLNAVSAPRVKSKKISAGEKAARTRARNRARLETVKEMRAKAFDAYEQNCPILKNNPAKVIEDEDELLDGYREKHKLGYNIPNEEVIKKLTNTEFSEYKEGMREIINQTKHPEEYHHYDILMPYSRTAKVRRL